MWVIVIIKKSIVLAIAFIIAVAILAPYHAINRAMAGQTTIYVTSTSTSLSTRTEVHVYDGTTITYTYTEVYTYILTSLKVVSDTNTETGEITPLHGPVPIRDGDWAVYRFVFDITDTSYTPGNFMRSEFTAKVVFHVSAEGLTYSVEEVNIVNYESNNEYHTDLEQHARKSAYEFGQLIGYFTEPRYLPSDGIVSKNVGVAPFECVYDVVTGLLRSCIAKNIPGAVGTVRVYLEETSVPGVIVGGMWSPADPVVIIGVVAIAAVATVIAVLAYMRRKRHPMPPPPSPPQPPV